MTKEEAITELNTFKIGAKSEIGENALDMAIRSLEAWDKVLKDVRRYELNCHFGVDDTKCKLCNETVFDSIQSIIKKHMKEVEK